jgi:hypothetical protein
LNTDYKLDSALSIREVPNVQGSSIDLGIWVCHQPYSSLYLPFFGHLSQKLFFKTIHFPANFVVRRTIFSASLSMMHCYFRPLAERYSLIEPRGRDVALPDKDVRITIRKESFWLQRMIESIPVILNGVRIGGICSNSGTIAASGHHNTAYTPGNKSTAC